MALTLTLTDGTTSLNLVGATYGAQSIDLGNPDMTRAEAMSLFRDGWDLIAHRFTKRVISIDLLLSTASLLAMSTAVQDLQEALRKARLWAMHDLGSRWRLQWNPGGSAPTISFVVKGGAFSLPPSGLVAPIMLKDTDPKVLHAPLTLECDPLAEGTEETLSNYFDNAGHELGATADADWTTSNGTPAADTGDKQEGNQSCAITLSAAAAQFSHRQVKTMTAGNHVCVIRYKITGDQSYEAYLSDAGGTATTALTADGTWRSATVTRNSGAETSITAGLRTTGAVTDVDDVVKVDDCYLGDGTTAPTGWVSGRDVRNHGDAAGQAHINHLDVYPRAGDYPAKVQIKASEAQAHTKFWLGARHGTRMLNAGIWHEAEDFATWDSEPADATASGGAYGRWASGIAWQDRDSSQVAVTDTITVAHTPAGTDRLLIVGVLAEKAAGVAAPTGVTFNGVALTKLDEQAQGILNQSIWYLIAPLAGAANVVATFAAAQDRISLGAVSYINVHQTTPLGAAAKATAGSGSTATVDVASAIVDIVFFAAGFAANGAFTPGAGVTEHWDLAGGSSGTGGEKQGAATTTTVSTDHAVGGAWAIIGVAIKPSQTVAAPKAFTKSVATPPVGAYRVLARIHGNGAAFGVAMGYAYGGVTEDPSISAQYAAIAAATNRWHVLDIGSIIIPPATLPSGATIGTLTLRLCTYRTATASAVNLDVDWVMLLPVDYGSAYATKASGTDVVVVDGVSRSPTLALWNTSDVFQSRPQQEGTPPECDPDGSRYYLACDDDVDATISDGFAVAVRIVPQYMVL